VNLKNTRCNNKNRQKLCWASKNIHVRRITRVCKYHYVCEAVYFLLRVMFKILAGVLLLTSNQMIFVVTTTLETINRQETWVLPWVSNLGTAKKLEGYVSSISVAFFTPVSCRIVPMAVSWKSNDLNWNQMDQFKYIFHISHILLLLYFEYWPSQS
jgi:hypothetical protein